MLIHTRAGAQPGSSDLARRSLSAAAGLAAAALVLVGCAASPNDDVADSPEASATSTPTTPPALDAPPQSEAHALESAQAKLAEYTVVLNAILSEGGASPERINSVAASPIANDVISSSKNMSDAGATMTGDIVNTVTGGSIADGVEGDTPVALGEATITTCFDNSQRSMTLADGSDGPMPELTKVVATYTVRYLPSAGDWFVANQINNGDTC